MNKFLKLGIAVIAVSALFTGCGEPSESAVELYKEASAKMADSFSYTSKITVDDNETVKAKGIELLINMDVNFNVDYDNEKNDSHAVGSIVTNVFGQTETEKLESYCISNETGVDVYRSRNNEWSKSSSQSVYMKMMQEIIKSFGKDIGDNMVYEKGNTEKVEGKDTYKIKISLTGDVCKKIVKETVKDLSKTLSNSSIESIYDDVDLSDVSVDLYYYVYKDTKLPAKIQVDMAKLVDKIMNPLIAATTDQSSAGTSVSQYTSLLKDADVNATTFLLNVEFYNYDAVGNISVPESVIKKAQ